MQRKLRIVPKPKEGTASVLVPGKDFKGPLISGPGEVDLVCGSCGTILVRGVGNSILNLVFMCPGCGSYNQS
jgi:hypothetical protein